MGPTIQLLARNEILLEGLRTVIGGSGIDVATATTAIGGIDFCTVPREQLPDVLALDAWLIGDNPFATIGELHRCHPELRIILL